MASSIACSRTVDLGRYRQRFTGQTKKKRKSSHFSLDYKREEFRSVRPTVKFNAKHGRSVSDCAPPSMPPDKLEKKKTVGKISIQLIQEPFGRFCLRLADSDQRTWRMTRLKRDNDWCLFFYRWEEMIFSLCLSLSSLEYRRGRIKSICYRVKHKAIENYRAPFFSDRLGGTCIQLERWGWRDFFFICSLRLMPMDEISPNKSFLGWSILTLRCRL